MCILALSFTCNPASRRMKGGIRLFYIESTWIAFNMIKMCDFPSYAHSYRSAASTSPASMDRYCGVNGLTSTFLPGIINDIRMPTHHWHVGMAVLFRPGPTNILTIGTHFVAVVFRHHCCCDGCKDLIGDTGVSSWIPCFRLARLQCG